MPRRNHKARPVTRGEAHKGRHKFDGPRTVLELAIERGRELAAQEQEEPQTPQVPKRLLDALHRDRENGPVTPQEAA